MGPKSERDKGKSGGEVDWKKKTKVDWKPLSAKVSNLDRAH